MLFRAIAEDRPGPKWAELFAQYWPAYHQWWAREGLTARPTYLECRKAIRKHMPEIAQLWEELCDLAGGGDAAARFLSFYCPPRSLSGCSQAIWSYASVRAISPQGRRASPMALRKRVPHERG